MNKKGLVSEAMMDFFLVLAFLFLFIIFFALMKTNDDKLSLAMESKTSYNDAQNVLMNCLKSNVEVNGETMSISDLISRATLDSSYIDILKEKIGGFLTYHQSGKDGLKPYSMDIIILNPGKTPQDLDEFFSGVRTYQLSDIIKTQVTVDTSNSDTITATNVQKIRTKIGETVIPNNNGELVTIYFYQIGLRPVEGYGSNR